MILVCYNHQQAKTYCIEQEINPKEHRIVTVKQDVYGVSGCFYHLVGEYWKNPNLYEIVEHLKSHGCKEV